MAQHHGSRLYYVLARDFTEAGPVISMLKARGHTSARHVVSADSLRGLNPHDTTFVTCDGFPRHHDSKKIAEQVSLLHHLGATLELAPKIDVEPLKVPEPAKAPDKYKMVTLGGPFHAKRLMYEVGDDQESLLLPHYVPPSINADSVADVSTVSGKFVTYRRFPVSILGEWVHFWVHDRQWPDRQRLVRDYLLFPLEV